MLEARVARLEDDLKDVKASLRKIELDVGEIRHLPTAADLAALRNDFALLRADAAEMKGRISQMPNFLQLATFVVTTWSAGAAIVFTLLRYAKP